MLRYRPEIVFETNQIGRRYAAIKPVGFWSYDMISVSQCDGYGENVWLEPHINWGSGGKDGKLTEFESAKSFLTGLQEAVRIAEEWNKDTGKSIK